jgi:azurin
VLEIKPETEVLQWEKVSQEGKATAGKAETGRKGAPKEVVYRTFVESTQAQGAVLGVKHGFLDVALNGVQLLSTDNMFSPQQQVQLDLKPGVNLLELTFRKLKSEAARPAAYLFDPLGQPISGKVPREAEELRRLTEAWNHEHASERDALKVVAIPNQLQFSPKELRVKAGSPMRLIFENPDLMQHNLVLVDRGAEEAVGTMADQMATKPDGMSRNFIPETPKVLRATALVNPGGRAELQFEAPTEPGSYPFLCTFPGHWRVMRGVLIVEAR